MDLIARQTSLSGNIVFFCRYLRTKGYNISSSEERDVLTALSEIFPYSEMRYQLVLRAILCKNKYQYTSFDNHYKTYKHEIEKAIDSKKKDLARSSQKNAKVKTPSLEELKDWLFQHDDSDQESIKSSYSNVEVFNKKEFSAMSEEELSLVAALLQRLAQRLLRKKSRLRINAKKGGHIDLRRTIRYNFRKGSSIDHIIRSQPKTKKMRLVLLCDVSRSMDLYSKFLIQMIYAFHKQDDRIETFVFSTALHHVTDLLDNHTFDQAFQMISDRVPQWSGGTRIGHCLSNFKDEFGYSLLDRKTVVMILSDGWDRGEQSEMISSMKYIYKESRKVIWLNPLAGHPDFKPEVIGLKSVLPYITKLLPAHNLLSLKQAIFSI